MKHFIPIDITITDSNIAENEGSEGTIYPFVVTDAYAKGVQRYYNDRLWYSFTEIYELATLAWNDLDPNDKFTTRLSDNVVIDSTTVPIVTDDIVYVYTEEQYYRSKQTRTVDFTTEVYLEANWEILESPDNHYRYEWTYPHTDSIFWKDVGATNRNKCVDKAINSQSAKTDTDMYFEFEIKNINKIIIFNLEAEEAKLTLYDPNDYDPDTEIGTYIYENTVEDLQNYDTIVDWRTLSQYEPSYVKNVDWTLPFFTGTLTARITLSSALSSDLKLGEILAGQTQSIGLTLDGLPISIKSSGKIIEQENGDIIFVDEGDVTKVFHIFNFSLIFDSYAIDSILDRCDEMINRRIVVFGENTDEVKYRSLIVYGFSRDASPTLKTNSTKSHIKLQVQRFI